MLAIGLCAAHAEMFLYSTTGELVSAFGADGKAATYGMDAAQNVSSSSTNQPVSVAPGGQAVLTAPVVPQANPTSTGISATANLSGLGGSPTAAMNDAGLGGDTLAGDGIFSVTATVAPGTPPGTQLIEVTFTDAEGRLWTDLISVDVQAASAPEDASDIPTLPEWGMILMAALLLLLAARNLPRRAAGCALAFALLSLSARAQDYPMWQNTVIDFSQAPGVAPEGTLQGFAESGMTLEDQGGLQSGFQAGVQSLSVPASVDAEVAALAASLGDGQAVAGEAASEKVLRIFNWVRKNIDYEHYFGLRKGAALTLLEGAGNDMDSCALLRDLLVAAGLAPETVKFGYFANAVDYDVLKGWMGLAEEPFPGKTYQEAFGTAIPAGYPSGTSELVAKQATFAALFLQVRGSGTIYNNNQPAVFAANMPAKATVLWDRLAVLVTFDGWNNFAVLDPAFKTYAAGAVNDLTAASGYSRQALLDLAAGTADADSVKSLNPSAIGTYLTARAAALQGSFGPESLDALSGVRTISMGDAASLAETVPPGGIFVSGPNPSFFTFLSTDDPGLRSSNRPCVSSPQPPRDWITYCQPPISRDRRSR